MILEFIKYWIISKYDTFLFFGVTIDIFLVFAIFGDVFFYIQLKNGFFKTCFRQSAKDKTTALNVR